MVSKAATSVALRPILSPKCPQKAEPKGLAKKATANVANDCSICVVGLDSGKKDEEKPRWLHWRRYKNQKIQWSCRQGLRIEQ